MQVFLGCDGDFLKSVELKQTILSGEAGVLILCNLL